MTHRWQRPAGEPGEGARKLYDVARESLLAGLEECRSGAHVADIDNGSRKPIDRAGLGDAAQMRFGVGIGIAYPPIWLSSLQLDRFSTGILEPGMTFYVHSWLSLPRDGLGVMLGGTYLVVAESHLLIEVSQTRLGPTWGRIQQ
ncbi:M24 family metallopeptidase [Mesorhizobium hawassense]|uniref:M24 family metallopeptidase n=1 Tax=Mesorhizobium hawassense TaxID=1209954 RepID=UPI00247AAC25|nr:M24 family metallopeptidase [Mesorhizobium hawassense]